MRNSLTDLKNYLFEQIERVNDDNLTDEELDKEIKRSKAVTEASRTIVEIAKTQLDAFRYATEELGIETNPAAVGDLLLLGDAVSEKTLREGSDHSAQ